jgi:predicted ATP-grasp superfamily ATP-dependent carboligase
MPEDSFTWMDEPDGPGLAPNAVLLSSFPSAGLAATVAAHYVVRALGLRRIGILTSPGAIPVAVVQGGQVQPPIRVYGRADLALVVSEFPPALASASRISEAILAGAEARKCRNVLCLEGVMPHPEDGDPAPDAEATREAVWFIQARDDPNAAKLFASTGARPLEDGVIGGVTGSLLVGGLRHRLPVAAVLVSAQGPEGFPDHRAGAALIEMLDRLMPELKIDTGPLRSQAEVIERTLRAAMRQRPGPPEGSKDVAPPADRSMYG